MNSVDNYLNIVWCMLRFNLKSEAVLSHILSPDVISVIG